MIRVCQGKLVGVYERKKWDVPHFSFCKKTINQSLTNGISCRFSDRAKGAIILQFT